MRSIAAALPLVLVTACSGDDTGGVPSADAGASADASEVVGGCELVDELPQDGRVVLEHDGRQRQYTVHVPAGLGDGPAPVVLNFHGYTSNADQQRAFSVMDATADERGFVVVYPDGTGSTPSWNGGTCCGTAMTGDVDDVGFVAALLDDLERRVCVDPERVYATGLSNGGFFSHRLACELSERIAGIAPVAGVIGIERCEPTRPLPVVMFHGTADTLVPYDGGGLGGFPSVADTTSDWAARNGCDDTPEVVYEQGDVTCIEHGGCTDEATVRLCTVDGGGHTWPSGTIPAIAGHTTFDVDANAMMWDVWTSR